MGVNGLVYGLTETYGGLLDPLPYLVRVYAGHLRDAKST